MTIKPLVLFFTVLFALAEPVMAEIDQAKPPLALHVTIRNYARVPSDVLSPAQARIVAMFKEIAVAVTFGEAPLESDQKEGPAQRSGSGRGEIRLHILPRSFLTNSRDALGIAQEKSLIAYVFYDRVQAFVSESESESRLRTSLAVMLACIVSHEVGHLLMPGLGHHPSSLMQAKWRPADFLDIETRDMHFNDNHASIIRARLQRNREQQ